MRRLRIAWRCHYRHQLNSTYFAFRMQPLKPIPYLSRYSILDAEEGEGKDNNSASGL